MHRLIMLLPLLGCVACVAPAPPPQDPNTDRIAFRAEGHDGAATGQVWEFQVTNDDRFTCQMASVSPLTGQVLPGVTGQVPGLYENVAALVGRQVEAGEWSIITGSGTISEGGEVAQIDPNVFYNSDTGGALSRLISDAAAPFGLCMVWG